MVDGKGVLNAALKALIAGTETSAAVKIPVTFVSELAALPSKQQEVIAKLSEDQFLELLLQSELATQNAASAAVTAKQNKKLIKEVLAKIDAGEISGTAERTIHNLPYSSIGDLFKGRDKVVVKLQKRLAKGEQTAITQAHAIHGLGGVGKTRLAVEFGWYQIKNNHANAVLFVLADSLTNLISGLADLAGPGLLELPEKDLKDQPAIVGAVLKRLSQMPDALVIFDNVDDDHAIKKLHVILPQVAGCRVLISSRQSNWKGVKKLAIDKLAKPDANAYLLEKTEDRSKTSDDKDLVGELADKLDGLPIALEQAAAYINYLRIDFRVYLDDFEKARKKVLKWHSDKLQDYPQPVLIAWQATEDQLGLVEKTLLRLASFMAPEAIPVKLFKEQPKKLIEAIELYAKETGEKLQRGKLKEVDIREILAELVNYSMITLTKEHFDVHRLVQDSVRLRIDEKTLKDWTEIALSIVYGFIPKDLKPDDLRSWGVWNVISPHVLAITGHGNNVKIAEPTCYLMNELALHYNAKASFEVAENLYQKALTIYKNTYGPDHPNVATGLNNLAALFYGTDRLDEAEPMYRRALEIDEATFAPDDTKVAIDLNNLAILLKETGRLEEAEAMLRRTLKIGEALLGPDHPDVAIRLNNLPTLLHSTNRFDEAEPMYRRALKIGETSFGPDHPDVANRLNNLAQLYQDTNRLKQAEPLMQRALKIDESSFGPDHPYVARDLNNLVGLFHETGRTDEAVPMCRRALKICEDCYGADHPRTKLIRRNLEGLKK